MEWLDELLDAQESTQFFMVGSTLVGVLVFGIFIAAYKRKGRVAYLMLPMALWFIFWLSWRDQRGEDLNDLLNSMGWDWYGRRPGGMAWPRGVWNHYQLIEDTIGVIVLLLALTLIFTKDKSAITTTESEEPSEPV